MAATFLLPELTQWTKNKISTVLEAKTQEDFDKAFDLFLAAAAQITVNGAQVTREEYKQSLKNVSGLGGLVASVTTNFEASVEQPTDGKLAGSVGIFCEETVTKNIRVFAVPEQIKVNFSINVVIKQDPSIPRPTGPLREYFDGRRAFVVDQVVMEKMVPIRPPGPVDVPADVPPVGQPSDNPYAKV